ncbi:MAG TPA: sugar phosphate isomerase/epimerase family protein [Humisphaera sp.]|nr:sugar phosphate isomerase/epimerase family protein [Humisphaera sp.]
MPSTHSRRQLLGSATIALTSATLSATMASTVKAAEQSNRPADEPFGYCLNTSTISGANLSIVEQITVASKAGYHAIEPWVRDIDAYVKKGNSLNDLAKRLSDAGITVEDAIAFANWVVDDDTRRAAGFEQMKRDMDTVAQIGAKHIAAPPMGATDNANLDLHKAAERYRALLELGEKTGVHPLLELWGHSKCLNRLADVAFVAIESARPDASMLLDIYHLHKGGTDYTSLRQINGANLHVIHMNDFPASPDRAHITDAHRVYPGDGVAPFKQILPDLRDSGFRGYLSLELFNRDYWKENPEKVAKTGIEKMREVVKKSLA